MIFDCVMESKMLIEYNGWMFEVYDTIKQEKTRYLVERGEDGVFHLKPGTTLGEIELVLKESNENP